jgi:hypothetical protein
MNCRSKQVSCGNWERWLNLAWMRGAAVGAGNFVRKSFLSAYVDTLDLIFFVNIAIKKLDPPSSRDLDGLTRKQPLYPFVGGAVVFYTHREA